MAENVFAASMRFKVSEDKSPETIVHSPARRKTGVRHRVPEYRRRTWRADVRRTSSSRPERTRARKFPPDTRPLPRLCLTDAIQRHEHTALVGLPSTRSAAGTMGKKKPAGRRAGRCGQCLLNGQTFGCAGTLLGKGQLKYTVFESCICGVLVHFLRQRNRSRYLSEIAFAMQPLVLGVRIVFLTHFGFHGNRVVVYADRDRVLVHPRNFHFQHIPLLAFLDIQARAGVVNAARHATEQWR